MEEKTTGSEYADSVRDVLEHAAEADAERSGHREPSKRSLLGSGPALVVLALTFTVVVLLNTRLLGGEAEPLPREQAQVASGLTVMMAVQAVEAHRHEHGALPASLEELGFPAGLLRYTREGEQYEVAAAVGGEEVTFSSSEGPRGLLARMGVDPGEAPAPPDGPQP